MDNKMNYAIFLSNQMIEEAKFDAYIRESVLISESKNTIENMTILTESFGDKIKLALAKVVEVFTRICGKFMETVDNIFRSNKGYLEKYKDTILKQKPTDTKWVMYDWPEGIKEILATSIPEFNYERMKQYFADNAKDKFCTDNFAKIINGQKEGIKLQDAAEFRFRGNLSEEREVTEASLNITDMYNFCIRYDTVKVNLQKDIDNVVNAAKITQQKIDQLAREATSTTATNNTTTPKPQEESAMSYYFDNSRQYRSFVYEGYVQEFGKSEDSKDSSTGAADNHQPIATNQSKDSNTHETDPNKAMVRVDKDKIDSTVKDGVVKEDSTKIVENITNVYINPCTAVAAAKMQCLESAFKDYMAIIKNKVQTYIGTNDKDNKQQADTATNQKTVDDKMSPEDQEKLNNLNNNVENLSKFQQVKNFVTGKNKKQTT